MSYGNSPAPSFSTFYLFATSMAAGVCASLPLVPLRDLGRRFFVLLSLVAFAFLALACVSRGLETSYAYLACAGFLIAYNVCLPGQAGLGLARQTRSSGPGGWALGFSQTMLGAAILSGSAGLVVDSLDLAGSPGLEGVPASVLAMTSVSSAFLLGSTLVAMVLGHWYLVSTDLTFGPLRRLTAVVTGALLWRFGLAIWTIWLQIERWDGMLAEAGAVSFFLSDGVFVITRLLFGFLAPLALMKLVWDCLKVESNQSATGILYVAVAFVFIGELLSMHYLLSPGLLL